MRRINSSNVSLALSAVALFVALGGTAVAVSGSIGTAQIRNGAVTSAKIRNAAVSNHKILNEAVGNHKLADNSVGKAKLRNGSVSAAKLAAGAVTAASLDQNAVNTGNLVGGAVTTSKLAIGSVLTNILADNSVTNTKLAPDAVTTDKVKDGSLTSADFAPNTFVSGVGRLAAGRVVVAPGSVAQVLDVGFGRIVGSCSAANVPQLGFTPFFNGENIVDWFTTFNGSTRLTTTNAEPAGSTFFETNPNSGPQSVTWQVGFNNGANHVATAETTGQFQFGIGCVFMGQGNTTG